MVNEEAQMANAEMRRANGKVPVRRSIRLLAALPALLFFLVLGSSEVWAETIRSIEIQSQLEKRHEDIRSIIRMKPGDEFSREKMEDAIYDLRKWGVFKTVEVLLKHEGDHVDMIFQLQDAYIIKDVEIHGNYPILEKKIQRAIFLAPGDIFEEEKIAEQITRLIEFYEKEGYQNTVVFIEQAKDEANRMVTLKIKIHKGRGFRIGEITIEGNTVFKDQRLKNKISRFFDFKINRVKNDLKDIEQLYRDNGFLRARARLKGTSFNVEKRTVDLTIEIREGKKIDLVFEGNQSQYTKRLKKIVSIADTGDTDEYELENSRRQLIAHYRSIGYEEVKVEVEKKELSKVHIQVTFKIDEGPRRIVKSIDFDGNEAFSDKTLRKQMLTQEEGIGTRSAFREEIFDQDLQTIKTFYEQNGFLEARVEEWRRNLIETKDKYKIDIDLVEGEPTIVEEVLFDGLTLFPPEEIRKFLLVKENTNYSKTRLEEDVKAVLLYFSFHGHPYATVKTELEPRGKNRVAIRYRIEEGPLVKVGEILLVGNVRTRRSTILNALKFKEGDVFNPQRILESQTSLRKLNTFESITIETLGLKGKEEVVHVVVRVGERKHKILDLGLTYDTDTSFQAKLTLSRLNILGLGKEVDLKVTGGIQFNRVELAYLDPRFFGSNWQFLTNAFGQFERRPFFQDVQVGGAAALLRDLTKRISLLARYEFTRTDFIESKTNFAALDPDNPGGTSDNTLGKFSFTTTYDGRDNFGDPRKGIFGAGIFSYGTAFQSDFSNFFKMGLRFGHWYSPFHRLTIANALRIDGIQTVSGGDTVPTQELIFYGGDDTIRGFKEDAVKPSGGKLGLLYNFELQMRLIKGFEAVGFFDTATLTDAFDEISLNSLRHSAGFGIRYITPVGPIRLDYGIILDREPGENFGRLHFTFGYFF